MRLYLLLLFLSLMPVSSLAETIWIDVRSAEEYQASHIEGDLHIPYQGIVEGVAASRLDKSDEIKLYCRSGGRAGKAKAALEAAGYTRVENAGGIEDVREERNLAQ